ncbi:hypothetical protein NST07_25570 [Paenibacillus sp. FSL L8-0340]|uniref:plasmid mobilization protein n=1 Tax=Paenibacillus sp. FSL L8-0340 TaxID=2954685 RepID=UPI0031590A7B
MGSENRKRNNMVPIRLSDEEFEIISKKAAIAEVTIPYYLRFLALRSVPPTISGKTWKVVIWNIQVMDDTLADMSYDYLTNKKLYNEEIEQISEKLSSLLDWREVLIQVAHAKNCILSA